MAWNARATWNNNQPQWRDSQWERDDSHCQWRETMSHQITTLNALLVSIYAEQKELNRRMQHIEELVAAATSSFSRPPPPPPPPPPAAAPPGRRKMQRSLSWPLSPSSDTDCDWHCVGTEHLKMDDSYYVAIKDEQQFLGSTIWQHLDSIFFNDLGFTKMMMKSLELHMRFQRVEIWHSPIPSSSKSTRRLVIQCRKCSKGCGLLYGPHDLQDKDKVKAQKCAILRFLKVPIPDGDEPVVCPAQSTANLRNLLDRQPEELACGLGN